MRKESSRIVMLCGESQSSNFMFHGISGCVDVVRVIIEESPSAREVIRWRLKRLGLFTVVGQLIFVMFNKLLLFFQRKRISQLINRLSLDCGSIDEELVTAVASINDDKVRDLLQDLKPDAVVVNGTRIISPKILKAVSCPFINTHVGITPKYRGVHGGYWAMANSDAENCGVTIHLVDEGVDTGGILYQARIRPEKFDSFNTYPIHQLGAAIPLMCSALKDLSDGNLNVVSGVGPSQQWFHPTIFEYVRNWFRKSVK